MSEQWKQERPAWCPHSDCQFHMRTQDSACAGKLPIPVDHDGIENTHRLCLHGAKDDGEWTFDLQINRGDAWNLNRVLYGGIMEHNEVNF